MVMMKLGHGEILLHACTNGLPHRSYSQIARRHGHVPITAMQLREKQTEFDKKAGNKAVPVNSKYPRRRPPDLKPLPQPQQVLSPAAAWPFSTGEKPMPKELVKGAIKVNEYGV